MVSRQEPHEKRKHNGSAASASREQNPLSEREMEVSRLLATGASNSEIARELVISPHTVKVHLRNVFEKLEVSSRTEATLVLLQRGWLTIPGVEAPDPDISAAEPPEPEPLEDVLPHPAPWQRVFLLATLATLLVLLAAPVVLTRPKTTFSLLSDAGRTVFGQTTPLALPRWAARMPLTEARSRHAAVLAGEEIIVLGGETAEGQTLDSVAAYSPRFNQWRHVAPMPERLANLAATELDGEIYVAGGSANSLTGPSEISVRDQLYALDLEQGAWRHVGRLPSALAGAVLAAHDGTLYLAGGWDGEKMRDEVWRMNPGVQDDGLLQWETMAQMKTPAAFLGGVVVDDELYLIGGYDGQRELADAAVLNLTTGEWRQLPSMSTPRSGLSAVYDGMAVFALGGGWTRTIETHERYDALANQWSNFPSPVRGDWRHLGAAAFDGRIWLIGGWSGGYLDTHQEYQSAFRALLPVIQSD
jgi:DNA-binding CsgD family transcriptional regulator